MLNVSAEDCGVPKMATHQELRVYVEDVNDNAPLFQQAVYHSNVSEASPAGTPVATVTATDGDQGEGEGGSVCPDYFEGTRPLCWP